MDFSRRDFLKKVSAGVVAAADAEWALGAQEADLGLTAFKYGNSTLPESLVFAGGDAKKLHPISFLFHLIQIPGHLILTDTGCDEMPGFVMTEFVKPVALLGRYGIAPEEITDVLISHAHHDHIGAIRHFTKANVYIQQTEAVAGKAYLSGLPAVHPFADSLTLFDRLEIRRIGGHTKGSCIVLFKHSGKTVVLGGDECYIDKCLSLRIPTGASRSPERSRAFVETYSAPEYEVHLCHDPGILPGTNGRVRIF